MLPEVREPEKSSDGNAIFLRDPHPDDLPVGLKTSRLDELKINLPPCTSRSATKDKTPDLLPCIAVVRPHAAWVCHPGVRGALG
jgi:hypothetical protein